MSYFYGSIFTKLQFYRKSQSLEVSLALEKYAYMATVEISVRYKQVQL